MKEVEKIENVFDLFITSLQNVKTKLRRYEDEKKFLKTDLAKFVYSEAVRKAKLSKGIKEIRIARLAKARIQKRLIQEINKVKV